MKGLNSVICRNCGNSIDNNTQFCPYCGNKVVQETLVNNAPVYGVPVYGTPYIQGQKKTNTGIIIVSILFPIIIVFIAILAVVISSVSKKESPMYGVWDCKTFSSSSSGNYVATINFMEDKFSWSKYNDQSNNYIYGDYKYSHIEKSNVQNNNEYFRVNFTSTEVVLDGKYSDETFNQEYEMGITKTDSDVKQAVLINTKTYGMYYCYKR